MSRIPSTSTTTRTTGASSSSSKKSKTEAINDLDLDKFLDLMITELQNQDPLNPLDNKDMLAQISQLRQVGSTDKLTTTLSSVLLGQNISSATGLIGNDISAVSDDGENIQGVVNRVEISDGEPKIYMQKGFSGTSQAGEGDVKKGKYSYRVVWPDDKGNMRGVKLDNIVSTDDKSAIEIDNLPISSGPKQIYRSGANGEGPFRLITTVVDGSQGSYVDRTSDENRSFTEITESMWENEVKPWTELRSYKASLKNVSAIRPGPSSD